MCELAIVGKRTNAEIHGGILGAVGVAFFHEGRDHFHHVRNVFGGGGLGKMIRPFNAERVEILEERLLERSREVRQWQPAVLAPPDRLVIDIRQVHHALDLQPPILEMPLQEILKNIGAEISNMGEIVNGRPTGVEPHLPGLEGREFLNPTG